MTSRRALALSLTLILGGCGALAPFESAPPHTLPAGVTGTAVGVCYSRLASTTETVRAIAAQACGKGETPRLVDTSWDLTVCPVLTPARAVFVCGGP
jgi:hypothetical protein